MNLTDVPASPPPRLTQQEMIELTGYTLSTIISKVYRKEIPKPLFCNRKYGRVWNREEVYRSLGFLKEIDKRQGGFNEI